MTPKTYLICVEKDVDILNAQGLLNLKRAGWIAVTTDYLNPTIVTMYHWFEVECDDIKEYKQFVNSIDQSIRIISSAPIE